MNIPLKVHAVLSDQNTDAQIVILKDEQNAELLPIWIGSAEGNAIRFALEALAPQRPLTHDLLKSFLTHLNVQMEKVVITDINNSTYYATLYLIPNRPASQGTEREANDQASAPELTVDARPSDAIALALRMGVPIYATEEALQKKGSENLDAWLERLKPKDTGPYDT
ncbi:MAG TPA: bifunctional nuclease family protein [Candidatus Manganitrophaceae bacterium]|nr:bifunctional nuclease family protein [Candidatus Manganitrophaceae bacterium]